MKVPVRDQTAAPCEKYGAAVEIRGEGVLADVAEIANVDAGGVDDLDLCNVNALTRAQAHGSCLVIFFQKNVLLLIIICIVLTERQERQRR